MNMNMQRKKTVSSVYVIFLICSIIYISTYSPTTNFLRRVLQDNMVNDYTPFTEIVCKTDKDCYPNGFCSTDGLCQCNTCKVNDPDSSVMCGVDYVPIIAGFLISLFLGGCGIDHCFMSACTCPGVCIGITKALTAGGFGIWWICDIVFFGTGTFNDHYADNYQTLCDSWTN